MNVPSFSTNQVIERLEVLLRKLEGDGMYVSANTVALAIAEIKGLLLCSPPNSAPSGKS